MRYKNIQRYINISGYEYENEILKYLYTSIDCKKHLELYSSYISESYNFENTILSLDEVQMNKLISLDERLIATAFKGCGANFWSDIIKKLSPSKLGCICVYLSIIEPTEVNIIEHQKFILSEFLKV